MAIEQWGLLRVPHLLWHWTFSLHDQYWPKPSTRTSALVVMKFIIFVYPSMFNNAAVTWLKYCWYSVKTLSNQSMFNTPIYSVCMIYSPKLRRSINYWFFTLQMPHTKFDNTDNWPNGYWEDVDGQCTWLDGWQRMPTKSLDGWQRIPTNSNKSPESLIVN